MAHMNRCEPPLGVLLTISEMPSEKRFDHLVEEAASLFASGKEQLGRIPEAHWALLLPHAEGGRIEQTLCRVVNREEGAISLSYVPKVLRTKKVCKAALRQDG